MRHHELENKSGVITQNAAQTGKEMGNMNEAETRRTESEQKARQSSRRQHGERRKGDI